MLYLGIDQHKAQITVNLRNEHGDVIHQRQVSTNHAKIDDFFAQLKKQAAKTRGFMAIVEICGFNHWLIKKLEDYGCKEIVVMQPEKTSNKKTDRRYPLTGCSSAEPVSVSRNNEVEHKEPRKNEKNCCRVVMLNDDTLRMNEVRERTSTSVRSVKMIRSPS